MNEKTCDILVGLITKFKIDYLKYLKPNNLQAYPHNLIRQIVQAIITNSTDESVIEFIQNNLQYL